MDSVAALREFGRSPLGNRDDDEEDYGDGRVDGESGGGDGGGHTIEIVYPACQEVIEKDANHEEEEKQEELELLPIADLTS